MIGIVDVTNPAQKTIMESLELGKNSILQSCAISNTLDKIGFSTFDGRSNISAIAKSPNGEYVRVIFYLC